jgi:hypothetical protein
MFAMQSELKFDNRCRQLVCMLRYKTDIRFAWELKLTFDVHVTDKKKRKSMCIPDTQQTFTMIGTDATEI